MIKIPNFPHFMIIYILRTFTAWSRNEKVDAATSYELEGRYSIPGKGKKCFCIPQSPDRLWNSLGLLSKNTGVCFPAAEPLVLEADH
jgi:hypothetical protein